jgi:hypothetical protein
VVISAEHVGGTYPLVDADALTDGCFYPSDKIGGTYRRNLSACGRAALVSLERVERSAGE